MNAVIDVQSVVICVFLNYVNLVLIIGDGPLENLAFAHRTRRVQGEAVQT